MNIFPGGYFQKAFKELNTPEIKLDQLLLFSFVGVRNIMPIVTISRGSYSRGKEIAEKLAGTLGYECISREIILEASGQFNIPEINRKQKPSKQFCQPSITPNAETACHPFSKNVKTKNNEVERL